MSSTPPRWRNWRYLSNMAGHPIIANIADDHIQFWRYPFWIASVINSPRVDAKNIQEIRSDRQFPEIVLHNGEILFCPPEKQKEIASFAQRNNIPDCRRVDIWGWINEPFLDTEITASSQENILRILKRCGFNALEVDLIRKKIGHRMSQYNFFVWEWIHLGHFDLLAAHAFTVRLQVWLRHKKMLEFYRWTCEIANRAPLESDIFTGWASDD